jgi:hypothetical protein
VVTGREMSTLTVGVSRLRKHLRSAPATELRTSPCRPEQAPPQPRESGPTSTTNHIRHTGAITTTSGRSLSRCGTGAVARGWTTTPEGVERFAVELAYLQLAEQGRMWLRM